MMYKHISVMLKEVIDYLKPEPGQNFVDCSLGGGGHFFEILKRAAPSGKVLGIDLDGAAIEAVRDKLKTSPNPSLARRGVIVQDNFADLKDILKRNNFKQVSGILIDLGISSAEYESGRGFSFQKDEPLDMRFDTSSSPSLLRRGDNDLTAEYIINKWTKDKLIEIFKEYGEESLAAKIANKIVIRRQEKQIKTTKELANLIFGEYKKAYKNKTFKKHPATKIFQSLRIAVNNEIENLEKVLPQAINVLEKGGRLAIISFHSVEDRVVKTFFSQQAKGCICPPQFPVCRCNHNPAIKKITKKPVLPSDEEIKNNPRSRSAKLRVVEKI